MTLSNITQKPLTVTGNNLTLQDFVDVTRNKRRILLAEDAKSRIQASREVVDRLVQKDEVVYGLTTGFGSLANVAIDQAKTEQLQENLIMSHSCSMGEPYSEEIVRGILLLRVNTFAKGCSGIRLSTVETILDMLNNEVYPFVPQKGSVGSSGDLAPLSTMFLVMLGKGEAFIGGHKVPGALAMEHAGIKLVRLTSKEGLALNNGTPVMTSIAAHIVYDSENVLKHALLSATMSNEALKANSSHLFRNVHIARGQKGQIIAAKIMSHLHQGSELIDSNKKKVQDAYSIRGAPVVLGASLDAFWYVKHIVEIEMNAATDNPLIFGEHAYSAANFHGQPIALAMDFLAIAMSEIANIAERRVARILDASLNEGLPPFLIHDSGLHSGFMIAQYAAASMVSENKVLAHPASVDSIPTCANQEDHVSMGTTSARKMSEILDNVRKVIAIEFLTAAQAIDLRISQASTLCQKAVQTIRVQIPFLEKDRVLYTDLALIDKMVAQNVLLKNIAIDLQVAT